MTTSKPPTIPKIKKWLKANHHCHNQTDAQVDAMNGSEVYTLQSMVFSAEGMDYPHGRPQTHWKLLTRNI